jgi:CIC family chloride channel protein
MPENSDSIRPTEALTWRQIPSRHWSIFLKRREDQIFLVLTLLIGALVGLVVVAFIALTERAGLRIYPVGGAPWRRFLVPVAGSLTMRYLLFKYFPDARGSGVPQTKAALYARGGYISLGTVLGKFFCTLATLASGIPLGREGPSVQLVGMGTAFAGIVRAPMTSVVMIFETTRDYASSCRS